MKKSQQKKLRPYFIGAGALAILVGVSIYIQWNATQQLYFNNDTLQEEEQSVPALESAKKPEAPVVEQKVPVLDKPTVDKPSSEEKPAAPETPTITAPSETEKVPEEPVEEIPPETIPEQIPDTTPPPDATAEVEQLVAEATTTLQGYQAQFVGSLGALYSEASGRFHSLPKDQQTAEMRDDIAMEYALAGAQLEADCDGLVLSVLTQLTNDLNRIGASVEPVVIMRAAYVQAKEAKKAEYQGMIS